MSKAVSALPEGAINRDHQPTPEEIKRQLANILGSPVFHGSKRCQQFLEYVCDRALQGDLGALKERTIAVEVFGRQPHIDLGEDTIVRVGAREVRKRLAQYYVTPEGVAAEIRIDLPSGSYAPDFRYPIAAPEKQAPPLPEKQAPSATEHAAPRRPRKQMALVDWRGRPPLHGRTSYLEVVRAESQHGGFSAVLGASFSLCGPTYVGFGDMIAANEVTAMLARN